MYKLFIINLFIFVFERFLDTMYPSCSAFVDLVMQGKICRRM